MIYLDQQILKLLGNEITSDSANVNANVAYLSTKHQNYWIKFNNFNTVYLDKKKNIKIFGIY